MNFPHVEKAVAYAEAVVSGVIPACKQVRQACKRALDDRKREEFAYEFRPELAERACKFIEKMPHTKGKWLRDGLKIVLEPWQCFIVCEIFGWVSKESGFRRFNEAYCCIPRKNAKSTLAAGVGNYMLCADGEYGAEVYSGATSEKQALEVFRPAREMVKKLPDLQDHFEIAVAVKSLYRVDDGSRFEPIIGNPGDGASPSCAIVDEYHEHDTDRLYDTMKTGMGAREQALMFVITTAGDNIAGPCYALQRDVEAVLDGSIVNENLFGIVYTIDKGDDWTSEEALRKANPNYGVSVFGEYLRRQVEDAKRSTRKQGIVKTKHFNQWIQARSAFFNIEAWAQLNDAPPIEEFLGQSVFGGLDLASKKDIAAYVRVFTREIEGKIHYYVYPRLYLPEEVTNHPDKRHYAGWVEDGHLIATEGNSIDHGRIQAEFLSDYTDFGYGGVGYDPDNATKLIEDAAKDIFGVQKGEELHKDAYEELGLLDIPQHAVHLSEPMKELEVAILDGRVHHDGNPCMTWNMSNVVSKENGKGQEFPRKEKPDNKIDGAVALILAVHRAKDGAIDAHSVYENRGIRRV